jgi:predicted nucleic acid-binding protein
MEVRWVLNASPIICLARAGLEELLVKLADEIVVPKAVKAEIDAGLEGDPARIVLAREIIKSSKFSRYQKF